MGTVQRHAGGADDTSLIITTAGSQVQLIPFNGLQHMLQILLHYAGAELYTSSKVYAH